MARQGEPDELEFVITRETTAWTKGRVRVSRTAMQAAGYDPADLDPESVNGVAAFIGATSADAYTDYKTDDSDGGITAVEKDG